MGVSKTKSPKLQSGSLIRKIVRKDHYDYPLVQTFRDNNFRDSWRRSLKMWYPDISLLWWIVRSVTWTQLFFFWLVRSWVHLITKLFLPRRILTLKISELYIYIDVNASGFGFPQNFITLNRNSIHNHTCLRTGSLRGKRSHLVWHLNFGLLGLIPR